VAFEDLTKNSAQVFFNDNQVSLDFLPGATDGTYTIFTFDQSDAYSGTLQDGSDFTFNYNPTSITVTVVPEPTIWSLMACGILLLLVRRFIVFAYRPESKGSH